MESTLELIANRYIKANPQNEYTARPFLTDEIIRNSDYRYTADFARIFPDAPNGSYVYAWGKYSAAEDGALKFTLIPKGPVKIWMNQDLVYGTDVAAERYEHTPVSITLPVNKGWNNLVLRFTRTKAGFGGEFGTWLGKLDYYFFRGLDRPEFGGPEIEGFDYTAPLAEALPDVSTERLAPLCRPPRIWTDGEKKQGVFGRIFRNIQLSGQEPAEGYYAAARTEIRAAESVSCYFSGTQSGSFSFFINGQLIRSFREPGHFQFTHEMKAGMNSLAVISEYPGEGQIWDFSMETTSSRGIAVELVNPFFLSPELPWIFAGPFRKTPRAALADTLDKERLAGENEEKTWWRLDMPNAWVRLYNENLLFGHWNYPLGVTLYGLMETGRLFIKSGKSAGSAITEYVLSHVEKSLRTLEYALFDKANFGGATVVHHLLTSIDSLDDCGSFGALVLETVKGRDSSMLQQDLDLAVNYVAGHIIKKQDRRPEGCFWRRDMMHHFHNGTLWADDLYMSVPFLCRYAQYKGDKSVLDLAALQFEGFRKHLFMEEAGLMAHVYDFKRDMNTGVPWGRGNGWTIFSLSELLVALPENHPRREFLLAFFRTHAAGCLACQDKNGMWHQVLNMPSSYIETSCTAMFIAAFCRGIRFGWFDGAAEPYRAAAEKAWEALETYSIDKTGNIHGVCRGSEFSFNPRYYAEHLLPRLNDTHGIGIVLLAGAELLKLRNK